MTEAYLAITYSSIKSMEN